MLPDILKKLPITTFILIFLYACGTLYLIAYWSIFGVDISNFVGITEIPKSFIFPFVIGTGVFVFLQTINLLTPNKVKEKEKFTTDEIKGWLHRYKNSNDIHLILVSSIIVMFIGFLTQSICYWAITCVLLIWVLVRKVTLLSISKKIIPNYAIRSYVVIILVSTPIICVALGKVESLIIYKNIDVTYVNPIANDTTKHIFPTKVINQSKLLGFIGDKVIISSIDNKKVFVLKQSSFDVIELEKKK